MIWVTAYVRQLPLQGEHMFIVVCLTTEPLA